MPNHTDEIYAAFKAKDLPHVYFNGFVASVGSSDVVLLLKINDQPVLLLNTSHSMAKTLVEKLGGLIAILEDATKQSIKSNDEIGELLKPSESRDEEND